MQSSFKWSAAALLALATACSPQPDSSDSLTIYTSRHYDSDYALYDAFTEATGVTVNVVEADGDLLIERVKADAENSPADLIMTVDAGRLWRANDEGLFAPISSSILEERVPETMRHPEGNWFAFSSRARVIVYAEDRVAGAELAGYESLAVPEMQGRICARSSGNIYNISLLSSLIANWGEEEAASWAQSVASNLAREPQGGDTDQIKAVAAGECDVALVNNYYFARLLKEEPETVNGLALHWPEAGAGVHVNVSGGGVAVGAGNPELAQQFLEFAVSDEAQKLFPELTSEYPSVEGITYDNEALTSLGTYKADPLPLAELGSNQQLAQQLFDRAGWP